MRFLAKTIASILVLGSSIIVPTGAAHAAPIVQDRLVTGFLTFDLCNGTPVELSGPFHFVLKDNGDGTFTEISQIQARGTSGGNEYVLNFTRTDVFVMRPGVLTQDFRQILVSKGSAANQLTTGHFDFTVFPPVLSVESVCVG